MQIELPANVEQQAVKHFLVLLLLTSVKPEHFLVLVALVLGHGPAGIQAK